LKRPWPLPGQLMRRKLLFILFIPAIIVFMFFTCTTAVTNNLDSHVYELPYKKGSAFKIVQGYGGWFSHKRKAALDFSMPVGTPVYAARGGEIYHYKDDSDEGGPLPKYTRKANYIIIRHSDESYACYWHLQKNGVVKKRGRVKTGELIGYSGNTGFVLRPHLHFTVKRKFNYNKDSFVRTKFRTTKGIQLLRQGKRYERPSE
jgi:murein DD-endopeptidase MepM/ murein hydrolase activator NlpD